MCPVVLRNSFGNIFAKYMHKCEHTFWRNRPEFRPEFWDAFMYIALFRLALSLENRPTIGGTLSPLPSTPERNCRYRVSKGTADMLSPHHKISFFSTLLYSVYTELEILPRITRFNFCSSCAEVNLYNENGM